MNTILYHSSYNTSDKGLFAVITNTIADVELNPTSCSDSEIVPLPSSFVASSRYAQMRGAFLDRILASFVNARK